jgi:hypothetical protein
MLGSSGTTNGHAASWDLTWHFVLPSKQAVRWMYTRSCSYQAKLRTGSRKPSVRSYSNEGLAVCLGATL